MKKIWIRWAVTDYKPSLRKSTMSREINTKSTLKYCFTRYSKESLARSDPFITLENGRQGRFDCWNHNFEQVLVLDVHNSHINVYLTKLV